MSAPDPKTVREIARTAGLLIVETVARKHIVHRAMAQHGIGHDNVYAWSEIYDRVLDELAAVLKPLTQPDEQQPAEATGGEQVQDGADELTLTAIRRRALTASTYAEWHQVGRDVEMLIGLLNAATARAESATVLPERWRALIAERDAAVGRAEEAEAEVANLKAYLTAFLPSHGDPAFRERDLRRAARWIEAMAADAAQEARSATETAEDGVQASGSELEFGSGSAGLSGPELPDRQAKLLAAIRCWGGEWAPIRARDVLVAAGYAVTKERAHQVMKQLAKRGLLEQVRPRAYTYRLKVEAQQPNDTTEDDRG